jgi:glycosyltransferase involved in cell wall biosynthesis
MPAEVVDHYRHHPIMVVVTAWGFQAAYGLPTTLRAVEQVANENERVGVLIAGSGTYEREDWEALQRALDETMTRSRTLIVKDVAWLPCAIAKSAVLVRGNVVEGDSNSIAEALQLGCVPVVADNGDRPTGSIVFKAGDAASMAAALRAALLPKGSNAAALVEKSAQDNLSRIISLYESTRQAHLGTRAADARESRPGRGVG